VKQEHHKNVQIMFSCIFKWYFGCIINTKFLFCIYIYIINIWIKKNYCNWICIYDLLSALFTFLNILMGLQDYKSVLKCHIFVHLTNYLVLVGLNHLLMYLSWWIILLYLFYYFKIVIICFINGSCAFKIYRMHDFFSPNLMKYQNFLYVWTQNEYKNARCHMVWVFEDLDTICLQSIWLCGKMVEMFKNVLTSLMRHQSWGNEQTLHLSKWWHCGLYSKVQHNHLLILSMKKF